MKTPAVIEVGAGEDGARLDRWIRRRWPELTQARIQKLIRTGQVRVDGGRAKADTRLAAGSHVRVPPLIEAAPPVAAGPAAISARDAAFAEGLVLFEDADVLVLNKPAGLAVQGGTKTARHVDRLLSAWGEGQNRPRLVHRLDRDTSGVLVLGKTPAAAAALAGAFAHRDVEKTYWAIVAGGPKPGAGRIDLPLAKVGVGDRELVRPVRIRDGGRPAITDYVTLARAADKAAWLALRPLTGRTHQLRAHLLSIGHPIIGDRKYGAEDPRTQEEGLGLQLHARRVAMKHPVRGVLEIEAPADPAFVAGLEHFGFDPSEAPRSPFGARR